MAKFPSSRFWGSTVAGMILLLAFLAAACSRTAPATDTATAADTAADTKLSPAQTSIRSIEVVYIQGEVLIDGVAPELGDKPGLTFSIRTGADARCDLVFNNGNALSVGQNAVAVLDFASPTAQVNLERGSLSSVMKKLETLVNKDSFVVQTGTAVAGVRGTSFCVWANAESAYICACNGIVRTIDNAGGNEQLIEAAHHSARLYSRSGPNIQMETAGMQFHTDELLQSVASRIGYTIDWEHIDG